MPSTRTLSPLVRKLERAAGAGDATVARRRGLEHERAVCHRMAACPAACDAMDAAASWLARNVPLDADVRDYPDALRLISAVEAALAAATPA